ncbi:S41 family peptidase [Streptomyces sp. SID13666]|uniref:S41 family peptidase n=1 Tax=unclassified Streptomyces TaxID=2593676 RepID=UPI0013C0F94E|nr:MULTISPECIES: S41 family peptidase [unclassified Streptomyces]NEA56209.1 S41 family peptidase [Streptomyces sp. SID13666]NEA71880.1 S41 family peptidase [Streptomyces sp. SID13588]
MTTMTQISTAPVVEETAQLVLEHYVFPEEAERLATLLRRRLAEGAYDVDSAEELSRLVTTDLQSVNGDRHLRLLHHTEPVPKERGAAALAAMRRDFDATLGGVPRVELRDGGVAVLELTPMLFPLDWAAEPLAAALTLVARADALVLDVRGNRGGDPDTVAFVCSYLLDERTHLNTMYWRDGERFGQSWSLPYVPGARFGGSKPLYVLTSGSTFSAAEELAYDLQQLGRAVVVGEVTLGGAHPRQGWTVHPHLEASIPTGRAINPVSGTDWEGTGVQPDVVCTAADALDRAHALARTRLTDATG